MSRQQSFQRKKIMAAAGAVLFILLGVLIFQKPQKEEERQEGYAGIQSESSMSSLSPEESSEKESMTESNGSAASSPPAASSAPVDPEPEPYGFFDVDDIPVFQGNTYSIVNRNTPFFTSAEIAEGLTSSYEYYSPLDDLGRCGYAMASLGVDLMPTGSRGEIYQIHPSGWQRGQEYEGSHLIAFQLAGENDNEKNLITGTHFLNNDGMRPFEEMVGDYVRESGNNVLYRVTPVYYEKELVARGVLMEALSLHDNGGDICYCVFIYNVYDPSQNRLIHYATGVAYGGALAIGDGTKLPGEGSGAESSAGEVQLYIVNKNSRYFHYPTCSGSQSMSERNRMEFEGTREEAIEEGYTPCPSCQP